MRLSFLNPGFIGLARIPRALALLVMGFSPSLPSEVPAEELPLGNLSPDLLYGVTVSAAEPGLFGPDSTIEVEVRDAEGAAAVKPLHWGDPDLHFTLRPRAAGPGRAILRRSAGSAAIRVEATAEPMPAAPSSGLAFAALPNGDWTRAQKIELGGTVLGSNDDRPYIPPPGGPEAAARALFAGAQWFTFDFAGPEPMLAHFTLDLMDRDVPADVSIFTRQGEGSAATLVPYEEGVERYVPEKSTAYHGLWKFIARTLKPGTYYIRVMGNHPVFRLRSKLYPPPPYDDPVKAIRAGMDYLMKKGDAWHGNTPRRGGVALRTANPLQETSACIACHPTHFTTRGELIAIENGHPLLERPSLSFLTERLYNNPRPIYGKPDAAWVRMISAPGNVVSRLGYMLTGFEKAISREERPGLLPDLGNYLEMYWKELNGIYTESNGNQPKVSGFEISLHNALLFEELHRRTGEKRYLALRDKLEGIIAAGEPRDNVDLCWKLTGLAALNKEKHAEAIGKLVEEVFSRQRADGTWAMPFGKEINEHDYRKGRDYTTPAPLDANGEARSSEFQTWHCAYALAKAGVTMDDPRLAKTIRLCLSRQHPSGAWQGNKDYKNFDTPFRDTQFAVMALSELFKGPGSAGWMAGYPPAPSSFDPADPAGAIAAMDQYWESPGEPALAQVRAALAHPQPVVRAGAAEALGRLADVPSLPELTPLLGDPSKLVQRAAAWALRQIASRRGAGGEAILAALKSPSDRTRWGAARVFNQHFRYLTGDWTLAAALAAMMESDRSPANRIEAAQALWRWWYWERSDARKGEIEDAFIAGLARDEHPAVRANLIEGLHNVLDDNLRYLYNSWIAQIDAENQKTVTAGHRATVKAQAGRLARALTSGTELQRDGVLRAIYSFSLRETGGPAEAVASVPDPPFVSGDWVEGYRKTAAFDPLTMGLGTIARIGNDTDVLEFYEDSAPILSSGLAAAVEKSSPAVIEPALRAVKYSDGLTFDPAFSARLLKAAVEPPAGAEAVVRALLKELLPARIDASPATALALAPVIESGPAEVLDIAGAVLAGARNAPLAADPAVTGALKTRYLAAELDSREAAALQPMLATAEPLQTDPAVMGRLFDALLTGSGETRRSAARTLVTGAKFLVAGKPRQRFEAEVNAADDGLLLDLLKVVEKLDYKKFADESSLSLAQGVVAAGLARESAKVRRAALDALRAAPPLQGNVAAVARVRDMAMGDSDPGVQKAAEGLLKSLNLRGKPAGEQEVAALLDYEFYKRRVEPVLQTKGADGESCAGCHMNHTILKLNPEIAGEALTDAEIRENYRFALGVVNLTNPEESLILVKPRMPFDGIELPGNYRKTHGGNVRWRDGASNEGHRIILDWIQGAREEKAAASVAP